MTRSKHPSKINAVLQAELPTDTATNWMRWPNQTDVLPGLACAKDLVLAIGQVQHLAPSVPVQHLGLSKFHFDRMPIQMSGVTGW